MSSIYQTFNKDLPNYEIPGPSIPLPAPPTHKGPDGADIPDYTIGSYRPSSNARDIDKQLAYVEGGEDGAGKRGPQNFYEFDLKSTPSVSGPQLVIPHKQDTGIPNFINNNILGDSSATLGDMVDGVNNGRVSDVRDLNPVIPEQKQAIINSDNKYTAVKGIIEETALSDIFFSDMNMDAVQKSIRYKVHENTSKVIAKQSENTLYIIMRSIMLQYGNFKVSATNLVDEIQNLNKMVIDYSSENITSNVRQYMGYLDDIQTLPVPLDRAMYNNKDNYTYDISNLL